MIPRDKSHIDLKGVKYIPGVVYAAVLLLGQGFNSMISMKYILVRVRVRLEEKQSHSFYMYKLYLINVARQMHELTDWFCVQHTLKYTHLHPVTYRGQCFTQKHTFPCALFLLRYFVNSFCVLFQIIILKLYLILKKPFCLCCVHTLRYFKGSELMRIYFPHVVLCKSLRTLIKKSFPLVAL